MAQANKVEQCSIEGGNVPVEEDVDAAQEYVDAMERQLAILVGFARQINELDLAGCVNMEMRGMQDAGWNTGATAFEVHEELKALCTLDRAITRQEFRSALSLYMQLSEAGGVYEGLKSMLQIIELKPYSMWPFQPLVRHRVNPPAVIGPNANAMFRDLASVADNVGMTELSDLLAATFRDDIRNGVAHADYIIWNNNLRLRRRNGGPVVVLTLQELAMRWEWG